MIIINDKERDYRIKKIVPSNFDAEDLIVIFSKYVDQTLATGLASIYKGVIGDKEFVILQDDRKISELNFNYCNPTFSESEKFKKMMSILKTSGVNDEDAFKCVCEIFFADVEAEAERRRKLEKTKKIKEVSEELPTWIPQGYNHVTGDMYTGIVIADRYGNQFTYVPYLEIYVSRYEISLNSDGSVASLPDRKAWTNMKYTEAYNAATNFDPQNKSGLLKSVDAIREAINRKTGNPYPYITYLGHVELRTGAMPENMIYNIDCLTGNHYCILQSPNPRNNVKVFGQSFKSFKTGRTNCEFIEFIKSQSDVGFRICLKR